MKPSALPIAVAGLTKAYGAVRALDDVGLDVAAGEFLTLLGPSGSGKTTLLMAIAGFVRVDGGSIRIGGTEVVTLPPHRRDIGVVFQNYALFPHMSVRENVGYPLRIRAVDRAARDRRVDEVLAIVQLTGYGDRRIDQLSGGQRQRVALARAIAFAPRILLMDEPLSALDKNLREHMQLELRRLHDRLGTTTVYVTHDQREALTLSSRVAVMRDGRIVQLAEPRDLYERPNSRFIAEFVGQSHFLPLEIVDGAPRLFGRPVDVAAPPPGPGPFWLVLRPEKTELARAGEAAGANALSGRVKEAVYQGDQVSLYVALTGDHEASVQLAANRINLAALPAVGDAVTIRFDRADVCIVPG